MSTYATERLKMKLRQRYSLSSTCRTARGRAESGGGARALDARTVVEAGAVGMEVSAAPAIRSQRRA